MNFDCLDASYQLITDLKTPLAQLRQSDRKLHTQLTTASASIALNIAEGRGREGQDRRHHWRIAFGSAEEVRAILTVAERFGYFGTAQSQTAHETLKRILAMLWRMTH